MKSRIKLTNFPIAKLTDIKVLLRNFIRSQFFCVGFSKSNHDFTLASFNSQIRKNLFTQIKQSISSSNPAKYFTRKSLSRCCASSSGLVPLNVLIKPIYENMISIIDFQKVL